MSSTLLGLLLVALLGSGVAASSCKKGAQDSLSEKTTIMEESVRVVLRQEQSGGHFRIRRGAKLVIELKGKPSTGYDWKVISQDNAVLKSSGEPKLRVLGPEENVEQSAIYHFSFDTLTSGKAELVLRYARPWEQDGDADVIKFHIEVE